jgi:hypothetical protein
MLMKRVCGSKPQIIGFTMLGTVNLPNNTVSSKRSSEGTDGNGVLKEFSGTAVHDCCKPYFK